MAITLDQILVLSVLVFILISLYYELLGPSFTFMVGVSFLGITGVLTPSEIISGFANEQIAVVIMLLLIGDIVRKTGAIESVFDRFFRGAKSYKGFLSRMMIMVSGFSAFLNNTPLVALMMPYVHSWCRRNNISPSKFLIPLSYAAILGGSATLIGTSTNLIVNGLLVDMDNPIDVTELYMFDFVWVGLPMIVIGYLYLMIFGDRLLPSNADAITDFNRHSREYIVEARVRSDSHLIGNTIEESGLKSLRGLKLVEVIRESYKISPVTTDVILEKNDTLVFAGDTSTITDLINSNSGLSLPEIGMLLRRRESEVIEIVVSQNSSIINKNVRDINFRGLYDAAILAVHRNGERISRKIGDVVLKAGDVLLIFAGQDFVRRTQDTQDFYFISKVRDFRKLEPYKLLVLFGGTFAAIMLSAFQVISLFMGLLIVILASLALKITNPKELPRGIDYNLGLIIVMSLALGIAMIKSGTADMIANLIITVFLPLGQVGLLFGIYFITTILAAYITNKAAVGIIFPISLTMATNLDLPSMPFILIVAYASAANFMTPIGYQTNLMVYGPGRYSFKDFFRIGFPLTLIYMVVTVIILRLKYL